MFASETGLELEGSTVVEGQTRVVGSSSCSKRPLLPDRNTVDLCTLAGDLTDTISTICSDTVSEALLAVSYSDDSLTVSIPCDIIDSSSDDLIFSCVVSEYCSNHAGRAEAYPL